MTPNFTLRAGHAGQIATISNAGYATVLAQYGIDNTRHNQILLTYHNGPISFGAGIENPSQDDLVEKTTAVIPDFAGFAQFNAPGGHSLRVTGEMGKVGNGIKKKGKYGWLVGVGAAVNLADIAKFNAGFVYTKGLGCDGILSAQGAYCTVALDDDGNAAAGKLAKAYGAQGTLSFNVTETTTFNVSGGYYNYTSKLATGMFDHGFSGGANIVWKPVSAFQVALEGDYYRNKLVGGGKATAYGGAVGFWFFF
jgi:hypothetical protein